MNIDQLMEYLVPIAIFIAWAIGQTVAAAKKAKDKSSHKPETEEDNSNYNEDDAYYIHSF